MEVNVASFSMHPGTSRAGRYHECRYDKTSLAIGRSLNVLGLYWHKTVTYTTYNHLDLLPITGTSANSVNDTYETLVSGSFLALKINVAYTASHSSKLVVLKMEIALVFGT
jgi:hypothetical protein